ncbi:UNVERIFIED_CONTAM: putative glycosyltransferase [Sesamum angustifolium]|uniref:Glycosyltransferase n=1 Tax=Sesamum angustifolium TaxID=2727405 RepID=A0AAW2M630_9LAMI
MEENRQFVTKDPEKAHLFYLPYSARQLQKALYVRNSHNMKPLSIFLRDYVNMLAAKYPFWNRTHGYDHFLVACHDWGPYTLTEHEELTKNTIKALCNADMSQWIFNGYNHGRVRPILLKYWGDKDEDMRIYGPLPNRVSKVISYRGHMKSSKYCICPMGFEVNSPRIIEAIYYECVPVIIADNFVPPLDDVLNWSSFSVIVAEKDIPKLKKILLAIPLRRYIVLQSNVKRADTKVLVFAWKCCREALPTISNLHRRGLRLDSACVLCDQEEEDIVHVVAESSSARFTWALSLVPYRVTACDSLSVDAWMQCAHESLSQIDFVFFCYRVLAVVG